MNYGGNITWNEPLDWDRMYIQWPWADWIRPQVDAIHVIGGKCVRLFGEIRCVQSSAISLATYLARWTQLVEYCADAGMTVYPCGYAGVFRYGFTIPQILSVLEPWAEHLQALQAIHGNIIGIDICNEPIYGNGASPSEAATLYAALKAKTTIPLTFSDYSTTQTSNPWTISTQFAPYIPYCDFLDFHNYGSVGDAGTLNTISAAYPNKDIMLGEFGSPVSGGEAARAAHCTRTMAISKHPKCIGALCWSIFNYDTTVSNQYGHYAGPWVPPYATLAAAWAAGILPVPPPPPPPPPSSSLIADTFTGSGSLNGHLPETGGQAWTAGGLTLMGSGAITGNGTGIIIPTQGTPNNCEATISLVAGACAAGDNAGIYMRDNASGKYLFRFRAESMNGNTINGRWEIYRFTTYWECPQGNANVNGSISVGSSYTLKAIVSGPNLTLQASENGGAFATKASWTDATHTSGNCGIHLTDSGGLSITQFEVK